MDSAFHSPTRLGHRDRSSLRRWRRWAVSARTLVAALALAASAGCASGPPPSLPELKTTLVRYVESQRYAADIHRVSERVQRFLRRAAPSAAQPALVLDIDETSLSNWAYQLDSDFCYDSQAFHAWVLEEDAPALAGVLALYETARQLDVAVFFVTGRHEDERAATEANLRAVGFESWEGLHMRPRNDGRATAAVFKTEVRRRIDADGFTILANVGDQESDLAGGFSRRSYKLPNPFYTVP
jgi:acid phosphatase